MTQIPREFEGTWEEIIDRSNELAGCRVRVTVLAEKPQLPSTEHPSSFRPASGRSLLRHAGTWAGDDFEDCLQRVYETRGSLEL
ncbi:hypothetical protein [Baaleninema sp.]|uniref:hypothetical protein n=1 Tax=Baaleninema sp. TaxID=3101197 RepID=UPI003CFF2D76